VLESTGRSGRGEPTWWLWLGLVMAAAAALIATEWVFHDVEGLWKDHPIFAALATSTVLLFAGYFVIEKALADSEARKQRERQHERISSTLAPVVNAMASFDNELERLISKHGGSSPPGSDPKRTHSGARLGSPERAFKLEAANPSMTDLFGRRMESAWAINRALAGAHPVLDSTPGFSDAGKSLDALEKAATGLSQSLSLAHGEAGVDTQEQR
jgi:hypothetical protein